MPSIPANLQSTELSKTELRISWDAVADADGYTVALHDESGAEVDSQDVTATEADFSGLDQAVFYRADVRAYDADGESDRGQVFAWISPGPHSSGQHLLVPTIQGNFKLLYRDFAKLMKPLRDYPDYWRFVDTMSFCDGPDSEDGNFSRNRETWRAEINDGDNTLIELFNEENIGEYEPAESTQHDKQVVSVSIEFDQSGKFLVAFEDIDGLIHLNWYDPDVSERVITEIEEGRTPCFVSTRYDKTGDSDDSERLFFYVRASDGQVVYRRQSERWETANELPEAPGPVAELLNAGKSMYGGLVVAGCYDDGNEVIKPIYWNAPDDRGMAINTDRDTIEPVYLEVAQASVSSVRLFNAIRAANAQESVSVQSAAVSLDKATIESKRRAVTESDAVAIELGSVALNNVSVENKQVKGNAGETGEVQVALATLDTFEIYHAAIGVNGSEAGTVQVASASLDTVSIESE